MRIEHFWDLLFQLMKHGTKALHVVFIFLFSVLTCTLSVQNIMNTCSYHDIAFTWSVYDPLLMYLVKSTSISVDEGEETG